MHKKGEYVVYRHDVCIVTDIRKNKLMDKEYYVITPIDDNSLIIEIPIENGMGLLRSIITTDETKRLIKKIPYISPIEDINDNGMYL